MADKRKPGLALRILAVLAGEMYPGLTRGEIRRRLGVAPDTEVCARIRELRDHQSYGNFDVRTEHVTKTEVRYYLLARERRRAATFLAHRRAA